jgi:methionine-gamma-lyase
MAWSESTRVVHHPAARAAADAIATPIFQSATFRAERAEQLAAFAEQTHPASFYTRWGNPTVDVLERVLAGLEGGESALAFASGMAAISTTVMSFVAASDHVVAGNSLYSGTTELLGRDLRKLGVEVDFVDASDPAAFERATRPTTRLYYLETPDNPNMVLTDIAAVSALARARGIRTVVDNTLPSPLGQKPLALGADAVVHSATKSLAGHSDVMAGCVVTSTAIAESIWLKQKVLGGCLDPHAAALVLRGVKTLDLRTQRQTESALELARRLAEHPAVERVRHPGHASHPQHELARRQMKRYGGTFSFEVKGGRAGGLRMVESTRLIALAVSLGGVESLIQHPASMTHAPLTEDELRRAGIAPGLVRLSVGIEDVEDLWSDLEQALGG